MNQILVVTVVTAIVLILAAYCFGLICGRNEAVRKAWASTQGLKASLRSQKARAYRAERLAEQLQADNAFIQARLQRHTEQERLSVQDHYTLARAAHELQLAAKTFKAINSEHATTAINLSESCLAIAQRLRPESAVQSQQAAPEPTDLEDAA